jgi:transcriptional regulator
VLHKVIRRYSFGTLVSVLDGELFATHLPFLLDSGRGEHGTLFGHLARANPQWRAFDGAELQRPGEAVTRPAASTVPEALVTFTGPHAYVSPSWYETPVAVPTWNYVAVHAYGRPRIVDDPARVHDILQKTVATYEAWFERPWTMDGLPDGYVEKMMANIVAFEMPIRRLDGKRKLSQNRTAADRQGVIAGLRQQGDPEGMAVAELMASLRETAS